MIVAHAVHYLLAAPAAVVLLVIAVATFVEGRRAHGRGAAVLRDDEPTRGDQPEAAVATKLDGSSDDADS